MRCHQFKWMGIWHTDQAVSTVQIAEEDINGRLAVQYNWEKGLYKAAHEIPVHSDSQLPLLYAIYGTGICYA